MKGCSYFSPIKKKEPRWVSSSTPLQQRPGHDRRDRPQWLPPSEVMIHYEVRQRESLFSCSRREQCHYCLLNNWTTNDHGVIITLWLWQLFPVPRTGKPYDLWQFFHIDNCILDIFDTNFIIWILPSPSIYLSQHLHLGTSFTYVNIFISTSLSLISISYHCFPHAERDINLCKWPLQW